MNIADYDFHDGYLVDIKQSGNTMQLCMESAEVSDDELKDPIILSDHSTIKGKLCLVGVKLIKINDKPVTQLQKEHDEGNIYSFDIIDNRIVLIVTWINHPPKLFEETDHMKIEIEAKKIFWENEPNMENPFWL